MSRTRSFDDEVVLAKAAHLFRQKGFGAVNVGDLESATGLSVGSLYNAFGNKRGILDAALEYYNRNVLEGRIARYAPPGSGIGGLRRLFLTLLEEPVARRSDVSSPIRRSNLERPRATASTKASRFSLKHLNRECRARLRLACSRSIRGFSCSFAPGAIAARCEKPSIASSTNWRNDFDTSGALESLCGDLVVRRRRAGNRPARLPRRRCYVLRSKWADRRARGAICVHGRFSGVCAADEISDRGPATPSRQDARYVDATRTRRGRAAKRHELRNPVERRTARAHNRLLPSIESLRPPLFTMTLRVGGVPRLRHERRLPP